MTAFNGTVLAFQESHWHKLYHLCALFRTFHSATRPTNPSVISLEPIALETPWAVITVMALVIFFRPRTALPCQATVRGLPPPDMPSEPFAPLMSLNLCSPNTSLDVAMAAIRI
jgi:hypothetical protein